MAERLRGVRVPTAILGVAVAALTYPIGFGNPVTGLDPSWRGALHIAVDRGLSFGGDIVYTFGPLGFLSVPQLWYDDLGILAFLFLTALWLALAWSLVWALRRTLGALAATALAFVVLALMPAVEQALVVAAIWSIAVLLPDRPRHAVSGLALGGAVFAAVELLIKLSVGPPVVAIIVIGLIGARARPWQLAAFAGTFGFSVAGLWLLVGGGPGDFVDYLVYGREIISGYSEALGFAAPAWQLLTLAAVLLMLIAAAAIGSYRDRLARACGIAIAAVVGFAIFKEGVVRADSNHVIIAIETMVVLWLALPWSRSPSHRLGLIAGTAVLAAVALAIRSGDLWYRLTPSETLDDAVAQFQLLFDPSDRADVRAFSQRAMVATYDLDERTLAELEGHTVSVDPWETAAIWAYDLDWRPAPVFQGYQAYTERLDELNAELIASASGPERILRENDAGDARIGGGRGVDGRFAGWDPPRQAVATMCNFEPLHTTLRWQVLGRVPDRCGEPRAIGSVDAAFGETVEVPAARPGEVVFARIEGAEVGGFEQLQSLLYRADFRYAVIDGERSFKLVPGTSSGPLLMNGAPELVGAGPFADAPSARTIQLTGRDHPLRYEFFAMSVAAPSQPSAGKPVS